MFVAQHYDGATWTGFWFESRVKAFEAEALSPWTFSKGNYAEFETCEELYQALVKRHPGGKVSVDEYIDGGLRAVEV